MNGVVADLLPAALAVALSPIPIIAITLVLTSERGRSLGLAFSIGWVVGLSAVSTLVVAMIASASDTDPGATSEGVGWGKLGAGLLLLGLAVHKWRSRPTSGETPDLPGWVAELDHATPLRALTLGLGLSAANPKNVVLLLAASASIATADLTTGATIAAVGVFVLIGSLSVIGPTVLVLVAPGAASTPLRHVREFMSEHGHAVMMVVLALLGVMLLGDGLGVLG